MERTSTAGGASVATSKCPYCQSDIDGTPHICQACGSAYHAECWTAAGGCAVTGCDGGHIAQTGAGQADPTSPWATPQASSGQSTSHHYADANGPWGPTSNAGGQAEYASGAAAGYGQQYAGGTYDQPYGASPTYPSAPPATGWRAIPRGVRILIGIVLGVIVIAAASSAGDDSGSSNSGYDSDSSSSYTPEPAVDAPLANLAEITCEALYESTTYDAAIVLEAAIDTAAEYGYSGEDLGEALVYECPATMQYLLDS